MGNSSPCPLGAVSGNPSVTRREVAEGPEFFLVGNRKGYDTDVNTHTLGSTIPHDVPLFSLEGKGLTILSPDIGEHTDCLRT